MWQPDQALQHTSAALAALSTHPDATANGAAESFAAPSAPEHLHQDVSPARWLDLLLQLGAVLLDCGRVGEVTAVADSALRHATTAHSPRQKAAALALRASAAVAAGRAADALNDYTAAQSARAAAFDTGAATAELLLAHGDARAAVGIVDDAEPLHTLAVDLLQRHAADLGLAEELAAGEASAALYVHGRVALVQAQLRVAQSMVQRGRAGEAVEVCARAQAALRHARAAPALHAALACAKGSALAAQGDVDTACASLRRAATIAAREIGCISPHLPEALLRATALLLRTQGSASAARVYACLRSARAAAAARESLLRNPEAFECPDVKALPPWFVTSVRAFEEQRYTACAQGSADVQADSRAPMITDQHVKEVAMRHFVALTATQAGDTSGQALRRSAQVAELHAALFTASAKYKQTCGQLDVPVISTDAPTDTQPLSAGLVAQWLVEMAPEPTKVALSRSVKRIGSVQAHATSARKVDSKQQHHASRGASVSGVVTADALLAAPAVPLSATLVFVAVTPAPSDTAAAGSATASATGKPPAASKASAVATSNAVAAATSTAAVATSVGTITVPLHELRALLADVRKVRFRLEIAAAGTSPELLRDPARPQSEVRATAMA